MGGGWAEGTKSECCLEVQEPGPALPTDSSQHSPHLWQLPHLQSDPT